MMKLDPHELRADADAHQARLEGPQWAPSEGARDDSWLSQLAAGVPADKSAPRPQPSARAAAQDVPAPQFLPGLEAMERTEETLTEAGQRRAMRSDVKPGWFQAVAGNPHSYDTPDPSRKGVCARILPTTYHRFETAQRRLKLRTKAATWEFLLRLGLAAAEQLP